MAIASSFRTIDVRPAEGWRVALLTPGGLGIEPMPGWLIQEEVQYDDVTLEDTGMTGFRRIVACVSVDGDLEPLDEVGGVWRVIGPGQPEPSPGQVAAEMELRRRTAEQVRPIA